MKIYTYTKCDLGFPFLMFEKHIMRNMSWRKSDSAAGQQWRNVMTLYTIFGFISEIYAKLVDVHYIDKLMQNNIHLLISAVEAYKDHVFRVIRFKSKSGL